MRNNDWDLVTLGDVTSESRKRAGNASAFQERPVYGVDRSVGITSAAKYTANSLERYKTLEHGMFAYNPMRLNIGSIGYCSTDIQPGLVSPDYVVFECDRERLEPDFLNYYINSPAWKEWTANAGVGSVRMRIYYKELSRLPILLPLTSEQRAIAKILKALDNKIEINRKMNSTLESITKMMFEQWFVENDQAGNWEEKPLPDAIDFLEGPGIRNWQYTNTDKGIRFINIRCIQDRDIVVEMANRIYEAEVNTKYKHFLLQKDDIVVSTSGTLGRFGIIRDEHLPLLLNTSVIRMRPIKRIITWSYLIGYIESEEFQFELVSRASGSVQKNFGPVHLKQIRMKIPPSAVLEAFEEIVEPIHRKILQNLKESRTLASLRDTLLPKLMRGEVRVKDVEKEL
jgi:type I restriction enzyme, S subunit